MQKWRLARLALGLLVLVLLPACSLTGVTEMPVRYVVNMPDGYVGPIMIVYAQQGGKLPEESPGIVTFTLDSTGLLTTSYAGPPSAFRPEFYYVSTAGSRTVVPYRSGCWQGVLGAVSVCSGSNLLIASSRSMPDNSVFHVGDLTDKRLRLDGTRIDEMVEQLQKK
jgi:hypothetical protein